ncbi:MAG: hypothetical protein CMH57_07235 [Myxococcales bacterium]|nr:hypothetical protein [Myxococcales bacterium]
MASMRIWAMALCASLLMVGCPSNTSDSDEVDVDLEGVVGLDGLNDFSGVKVKLAFDDGGLVGTTETDASGAFIFRNVPERNLRLDFTRGGYLTRNAVDVLYQGGEKPFLINEGQEVVLLQDRRGAVQGVLTSESANVFFEDAVVRLDCVTEQCAYASSGSFSAVSDPENEGQGVFSREGLVPGRYQLTIRLAGFQPINDIVDVSGEATAQLSYTLVSDAVAGGSAAVALMGQVLLEGEPDAPRDGIVVRVYRSGRDTLYTSAIAGEEGLFATLVSPDLDYKLSATLEGWNDSGLSEPYRWDETSAMFTNAQGASPTLTLTRRPFEGSITVRVGVSPSWLPDNERRTRVRLVSSTPLGDEVEETVEVGHGETVTFAPLKAGTYLVKVERPGFEQKERLVILGGERVQEEFDINTALVSLAQAGLNLSGLTLLDTNLTDLGEGALRGANLAGVILVGAGGAATLCGADLSGASLVAANMDGVDLTGAVLVGTNLSNASVRRSTLTGADMSGANFFGANLQEANLSGVAGACAEERMGEPTNLAGADFSSANLSDVVFSEAVYDPQTQEPVPGLPSGPDTACEDVDDQGERVERPQINLDDVVLSQTNLSGALMDGVDLERVDLSSALLQGTRMNRACLRGGSFILTNMRNAQLNESNLQGTLMLGAILRDASFQGAWLTPSPETMDPPRRATDLTGANLVGTDLRDARLDEVNLLGVIAESTNFAGATLTDSRASGVVFSSVNFSGATITRTAGIDRIDPDTGVVLEDPRGLWRNTSFVNCSYSNRVDMSHLRLRGASFSFEVLSPMSDADVMLSFRSAELISVELSEVDLSGADLSNAELSGANLFGVRADDVPGCPAALPEPWRCVAGPVAGRFVLVGPNATLSGVDLSGVDLSGVDLSGADLSGANLTGANLLGCELPGADLSEVNLSGVDLSGANLAGAELSGVRGSDLLGCPDALPFRWFCIPSPSSEGFTLIGPEVDLSEVDLSAVDLTGVDLSGADLSNADLIGVRANNLLGCPDRLPEQWICVPIPLRGIFALIGPGADLFGMDLAGALLAGVQLPGVDLARTNLSGADLSGADLSGADLSFADLSFADLSETSLAGADLSDTQMIETEMPGANLSGANLSRARVRDANLSEVNLSEADLSESEWAGVEMAGADLAEAYFFFTAFLEVNLSGATLTDAVLIDSGLIRADLTGVILTGVDLQQGIRLSESDLSGLDLSGLNLSRLLLDGCNFSNTDLSQADLSGSELFGATLQGAVLDGADMSRASIPRTDLSGVDFSGVNLFGADLSNSTLSGALLQESLLTSALLRYTNLSGADLSDADLTGASLDRADLTNANLAGATGLTSSNVFLVTWDNTTCPDGTNSDGNGGTCVDHL